MTETHRITLRFAAALWVIWGLVHAIAALLVIPADPLTAMRRSGRIPDMKGFRRIRDWAGFCHTSPTRPVRDEES